MIHFAYQICVGTLCHFNCCSFRFEYYDIPMKERERRAINANKDLEEVMLQYHTAIWSRFDPSKKSDPILQKTGSDIKFGAVPNTPRSKRTRVRNPDSNRIESLMYSNHIELYISTHSLTTLSLSVLYVCLWMAWLVDNTVSHLGLWAYEMCYKGS